MYYTTKMKVMNEKIYKIVGLFILLIITVECSNPPSTENRINNKLIELESTYRFKRSVPHTLLNRILSEKNQVLWSTNFHTAAPVPIGAVGPEKYTQMLKGIIHNDSLGRVLKTAVSENVNVILVIGDGMGNMHMSLPVYLRHGNGVEKTTMFEKIMAEGTCGYLYTSTARGLVTGSAASGTAIACGKKTLMNMVGVDSTGTDLESALSLASRHDYKTAIVTDAGITDATPASFYAHTPNRNQENEIAFQLAMNSDVDIILGGGGKRFIPRGTSLSEYLQEQVSYDFSSSRTDPLNLLKVFKKKSYQLCFNLSQLNNVSKEEKILGLFSGGGLPAPIDRNQSNANIPTVHQMSSKALEIVNSSTDPFFAMIECARIDWESHDNDLGAVYRAVLEMNKVLETAYSTYKQAPEKTLLVFTSDHETGGLEIAYKKLSEQKAFVKALKNGETWTSKTSPLSFKQYTSTLENQSKSVSKLLRESESANELKQNVEKFLGYEITDEEAELIFFSMTNYRKHKK